METGETILAFASNTLGDSNLPDGFRRNDPSGPPAGIEIALIADDVEAAFRSALDAGATQAAGPKQKPWGQTVAYVRDPEGILVEIGDPVARRKPLEEGSTHLLIGRNAGSLRSCLAPLRRLLCVRDNRGHRPAASISARMERTDSLPRTPGDQPRSATRCCHPSRWLRAQIQSVAVSTVQPSAQPALAPDPATTSRKASQRSLHPVPPRRPALLAGDHRRLQRPCHRQDLGNVVEPRPQQRLEALRRRKRSRMSQPAPRTRLRRRGDAPSLPAVLPGSRSGSRRAGAIRRPPQLSPRPLPRSSARAARTNPHAASSMRDRVSVSRTRHESNPPSP